MVSCVKLWSEPVTFVKTPVSHIYFRTRLNQMPGP
jgi:hypothetical protein